MEVPLLWSLAALALAAPPAGLLAEETEQWDAHWSRLQDGPPGCWEVVGRASWDWDFGRYGIARGSAAFVGKLEDGVWRDMVVRSLGETVERHGETPIRYYPHDELRFAPMVGRLGPHIIGSENVEGDVLSEFVDMFGGEVTTSWSGWDEPRGGVVLHRTMAMGNDRVDGVTEVLFPDGGEVPTRLDFTINQPFALPDSPSVRIREAQARIRGHAVAGEAFADSEAISFVASLVGYKVWGSQTVRYDTYRPCGGEMDAELKPILP